MTKPTEQERVSELQSYAIMDTPAEQIFDNIAKMAALVCQCPYAQINFIDDKRYQPKAVYGGDAVEFVRGETICEYTFEQRELTVSPDLSQDERFKNHPMVCGGPQLRFYVGLPLISTSGNALGTLCVFDTETKELSEAQTDGLKILTQQIANLLDRRREKNEIEKLNEKLTASYKDLEAFSYTVSHDLKAPLNTVSNFVDVITEDYGSSFDGELRQHLERIKSSVLRMNDMVRNLLKLSNSLRHEIERETVDVTKILQNAAKDYAETNAVIEIAAGLKTYADPVLTAAVFKNLLENAVKYSRAADRPHIQIYAAERNGKKYIAVSDNGIGFDAAHASHIWQPFHRLNPKSAYSGSGIGLSIVKKAIDRHEGDIFFESAPGEGATFFVRF